MSNDMFEMPDMDEIQRSLNDAMENAQEAMDALPEQLAGLEDVMGSLSSLMGSMPSELTGLSQAVEGFKENHTNNLEALVGEPDWELKADIHVGEILHIVVHGELDITKTIQAWQSTQGGGFDSLVSGLIGNAADDLDEGTMGQVMEQLKMGRGMARVIHVDVLACSIQGAPGNAGEEIKLSPEGNIPLFVNDGSLCLEFAPMLTIRNQWENASLPSFVPMADEIQVPLSEFVEGIAFERKFKPTNQEQVMVLDIQFSPLC